MNQRLQHIVEHYDEMCIGTDEHFRFHCKQCGKCCINREDILLNPKDLYNISKELGLAPRDTIAQYCEVYLGQTSRIPIVRLKPRGSIKRCPLLRDRKCSVHNAKPTVCALFPLGRSIKLDAKETDPNAIERARIQYIINSIECGDRSEEHTVREWIGLTMPIPSIMSCSFASIWLWRMWRLARFLLFGETIRSMIWQCRRLPVTEPRRI